MGKLFNTAELCLLALCAVCFWISLITDLSTAVCGGLAATYIILSLINRPICNFVKPLKEISAATTLSDKIYAVVMLIFRIFLMLAACAALVLVAVLLFNPLMKVFLEKYMTVAVKAFYVLATVQLGINIAIKIYTNGIVIANIIMLPFSVLGILSMVKPDLFGSDMPVTQILMAARVLLFVHAGLTIFSILFSIRKINTKTKS